jgi:uncharacterized damage-inducible protein DinB
MINSINEFLTDWETESGLTLKVFKNLTDDSLDKPIPGYRRTIGRLAWHITGAIGEMMRSSGNPINAAEEDDPQPAEAAKLYNEYETASKALAEELKKNWTDASLSKQENMYGEMWTREFILRVIVAHQIHHRAQLTVLMSIAGLPVPGVYGPSYIEWQQMGREPLK